jgi:hypothetical protein
MAWQKKIDWVEVLIVVATLLISVAMYNWSWQGLVLSAAMILFGYVSGDMLWDLWRRK